MSSPSKDQITDVQLVSLKGLLKTDKGKALVLSLLTEAMESEDKKRPASASSPNVASLPKRSRKSPSSARVASASVASLSSDDVTVVYGDGTPQTRNLSRQSTINGHVAKFTERDTFTRTLIEQKSGPIKKPEDQLIFASACYHYHVNRTRLGSGTALKMDVMEAYLETLFANQTLTSCRELRALHRGEDDSVDMAKANFNDLQNFFKQTSEAFKNAK